MSERARLFILATLAAGLAAGCTNLTHGASGPSTDQVPSPTASPALLTAPATAYSGPSLGAFDVVPVSATHPTDEAAAIFEKCQVGIIVRVDQVAGMGRLPSASDLVYFVALTGNEPQLTDSGAVWVVQLHGDAIEPDGSVWTDPTCVVTSHGSGFFATGPVTDSAGDRYTPPPPAVVPNRTLPPLAP